MKAVMPSPSVTSMPPSCTALTVQVTTSPFLSCRPRRAKRVVGELLDAEADALLLDVDVEHLDAHVSPFL
jgi:hypothetical protein